MWLKNLLPFVGAFIGGLIYISICGFSSNTDYDKVPVCKGLQMRKDEIKNNPEQFLKDALNAIKVAQHKHQCRI